MEPEEATKVADIDRSERIRVGYQMAGGKLQQIAVNWDSPPWSKDGEGEYTMAAQVRFCQEHLGRNGRMYGAFDGEKLVGIGLIQPEIEEGMSQLAYLHVSNQYRRLGIGRHITAALIQEAKQGGANKMYVSATPSGSAVGFYRSQGFEPVEIPNPELFALEPEDIHMARGI